MRLALLSASEAMAAMRPKPGRSPLALALLIPVIAAANNGLQESP